MDKVHTHYLFLVRVPAIAAPSLKCSASQTGGREAQGYRQPALGVSWQDDRMGKLVKNYRLPLPRGPCILSTTHTYCIAKYSLNAEIYYKERCSYLNEDLILEL